MERVYAAGFPFFNLYKLMVIARGRQIVSDLEEEARQGAPKAATRFALAFFELSFRLNLLGTPFGWQLVAVATVPPR